MPTAWELLAPVIRLEYEDIEELQHELVPPLRAILPHRDYPRWFSSREDYGDTIVNPQTWDWLKRTVGEWAAAEPLRWRFA
jgi:hypothetical protein